MSALDRNEDVRPEAVTENAQHGIETISGHTTGEADRKDPGPPPDSGLRAWSQVLVGHLVVMNTWYGVL
jgi:hypothetical protein